MSVNEHALTSKQNTTFPDRSFKVSINLFLFIRLHTTEEFAHFFTVLRFVHVCELCAVYRWQLLFDIL